MIVKPDNKGLLKQFIDLPEAIYRDDPNWVRPLVGGDISTFSPTRGPNRNISNELFLAMHNSRPVGRIALFIDKLYNKIHKEKTAFFGFFECENNPQTALELLNAVEESARKKGFSKVTGPVDYSTNYQSGLLVQGFSRPTIMTPYNKNYYQALIEGAGYTKVIDEYSYMFTKNNIIPERAYRIEDIVRKKRPSLSVIPLSNIPGSKKASVLTKVYNEAFSHLWGFVPMTNCEFSHLVKSLSRLDHSDLNYAAFIDRIPVGILLTVPDLYSGKNNPAYYISQNAKKIQDEKFTKLRLTVIGVVPEFRGKGIETVMGMQAFKDARKRSFETIEFSVILENNTAMNNLINREFCLPIDKIFRVYEKKL